jgi:hypothetical protein
MSKGKNGVYTDNFTLPNLIPYIIFMSEEMQEGVLDEVHAVIGAPQTFHYHSKYDKEFKFPE